MNRRSLILLGTAVVIIAVAIWRLAAARTELARQSSDFPDGTLWLCAASDCGAEFSMSISQLATIHRAHPDDPAPPVPCPKCGGTQTRRAQRCPLCSAAIPPPDPAERPPICPKCHKPLPRLAPGGA